MPSFSAEAQGGSNILLLAPETRQRRQLLRSYCNLIPFSQYQSLTQDSSQPIVAEIKKVGSDWWVETGSLVQASNGTAVVDVINHVDEGQKPCLSPTLTETQIRLGKAGIDDAVQQQLNESCVNHSKLEWIGTALARLCGQQYVLPRDVDRAEHVLDYIFPAH